MDQQDPTDWQLRALRSWHLAILRFAVTRDHADRLGVLAVANEIDRLGMPESDCGEFGFFRRTSIELCEAILHPDQASRETTLRRYLARIDDLKLKRALAIVMDLEQLQQAPRRSKPYSALWRKQLSRHGA
jgi:hypothetical protein